MDWPWAQLSRNMLLDESSILYKQFLVSAKAPWPFGKTSGCFCTGKDAEVLFPLKEGFKSVPELQITFRRLISLNPSTSQLIQAQRALFFLSVPSSLHSLNFSCLPLLMFCPTKCTCKERCFLISILHHPLLPHVSLSLLAPIDSHRSQEPPHFSGV